MYETYAVWEIAAADGTTVQFNVGAELRLEDVSGFDSPNVRQNIEDLPEADGSAVGDFFYGSRPVTLSGRIVATSAAQRNTIVQQLQQACRALRSDLTVRSQPQGMPAMQVTGRLQNLRVTGGYVKQFQIGLVCQDPRIYAQTQTSLVATAALTGVGAAFPLVFDVDFGGGAGGSVNLTASNGGNVATPPVLKVFGPVTNPWVTNATTGESIYLDGVALDAGEWVEINVGARTAVTDAAANLYSKIRFPDSAWWLLQPGSNLIQLWATSSSTGAELDVTYADAWA